jgi:hypothetical protein
VVAAKLAAEGVVFIAIRIRAFVDGIGLRSVSNNFSTELEFTIGTPDFVSSCGLREARLFVL